VVDHLRPIAGGASLPPPALPKGGNARRGSPVRMGAVTRTSKAIAAPFPASRARFALVYTTHIGT